MSKMGIKTQLFGWENEYEIYSDGRIFSLKKNRFLKPSMRGLYLGVVLSRNKYIERWSIHRLVAMAFLPNPLNKPCVNHKDGNKLNNHVLNLEWVSYSENEKHSIECLGKRIKHSEETKQKIRDKSIGRDMKKLWEKSVLKRKGKPSHNRVSVTRIDNDGSTKKYNSISEAAKDVNGSIGAFTALKKKEFKTYKSYLWTFEN